MTESTALDCIVLLCANSILVVFITYLVVLCTWLSAMEACGHPSDPIRLRTVVLTVEDKSHLTPVDFLPVFQDRLLKGQITAFGTVGVGYVWHLTLDSSNVTSAFVQKGDFNIGSTLVKTCIMDQVAYTAFVHWIPFWVPHVDVECALASVLQGTYKSSYIRIAQKGYEGCFSTQRRIRSTADMSSLPHFIKIHSEGLTYKGHVFVPGRKPVCFNCGSEGHMKSDCGAIANPEVSESVQLEELPFESMPESTLCAGKPVAVRLKRSIKKHKISVPKQSKVSSKEIRQVASLVCEASSCGLNTHWKDGLISWDDMADHLIDYHK